MSDKKSKMAKVAAACAVATIIAAAVGGISFAMYKKKQQNRKGSSKSKTSLAGSSFRSLSGSCSSNKNRQQQQQQKNKEYYPYTIVAADAASATDPTMHVPDPVAWPCTEGKDVAYDRFDGVRLGHSSTMGLYGGVSMSECAVACSMNQECTGFTLDSRDGTCVTSVSVPEQAAMRDPRGSVFVKRPISSPPTANPLPEDRMSKRSGQRDRFETLPRNLVPTDPDVSELEVVGSTQACGEDVCQGACRNVPSCTSYRYWPWEKRSHTEEQNGAMNCTLYGSSRTRDPATGTALSPSGAKLVGDEVTLGRDVYGIRLTSDHGEWGPLPPASKAETPCACGETSQERECKKEPCTSGVSHVACKTNNSCIYQD